MISLLLLTSLACPATIKINRTDYPWNDFDQKTYERALYRCEYYYPTSPCLKKFIKTAKIDYRAICGKKQ